MKTLACKKQRKIISCAIAIAGLAAATQAQTLLYQWNFDGGSGTTVAPNVAVGGGGGLTMNYGGSAASLYGGPGSGVSGAAGDLSFANNNTIYGTAASSGLASSTAGNMNIGALTQFTMTGWIKADGGFSSQSVSAPFSRLFMIGQGTPDTGSANAATLAIFNNAPAENQVNTLQIRLSNVNGPSINPTDGGLAGNNALLPYNNGWTFFAASVDLTATANNVNFYLGDVTSLSTPITLSYNNAGVAIGSINFGTTASALFLNRGNEQRGFDGWGDDFRFYSGALSSTALNAVRIQAVPEPSTLAVLGMGSLAGLLALRRRRG